MMLFVSIIYICAAVKPIPSVLTVHQEFYLQFLFEGLMSSHAGGKNQHSQYVYRHKS